MLDVGLLLSAPLLSLAVAADALPESDDCSPLMFFLLPLLKSVSYQPVPLSLKPAADICFFSLA